MYPASRKSATQNDTLTYLRSSIITVDPYGTDTSLAMLANELRHRMGYKKVIVILARKLTILMLSVCKLETFYNERLNWVN